MIKKIEDVVVAVLGLSGSGKTTFCTALNHEAKITIAPTPTYNHGIFYSNGKNISMWDCGGSSDAQKNYWDTALAQAEGLIWMVDVSDSDKFDASVVALKNVISKLGEHKLPLLILGNKSDLKGDIIKFDQKFSVFKNSEVEVISASTGKNIEEAFTWLVVEINAERKRKTEAEKSREKLRIESQEYRRKHDKDD